MKKPTKRVRSEVRHRPGCPPAQGHMDHLALSKPCLWWWCPACDILFERVRITPLGRRVRK